MIPIGVSYSADPDEVERLLKEVAKESDAVLGFPEPFVAFVDFGASSLDFSLRCYVSDVNSSLSAKSALRKEIVKRFREHGIEIPFPQQDVHLRDLDAVRDLLARANEQRRAEQAARATVEPHVGAETQAGTEPQAGAETLDGVAVPPSDDKIKMIHRIAISGRSDSTGRPRLQSAFA